MPLPYPVEHHWSNELSKDCLDTAKPLKKFVHQTSGLSYVLAYNSANSEAREPVLQHAAYYRLYHRSCFAGRKTHTWHVPLRVAPVGLRYKPVGPSQRGVPGDLRVTGSPPGNPLGSRLRQASQ